MNPTERLLAHLRDRRGERFTPAELARDLHLPRKSVLVQLRALLLAGLVCSDAVIGAGATTRFWVPAPRAEDAVALPRGVRLERSGEAWRHVDATGSYALTPGDVAARLRLAIRATTGEAARDARVLGVSHPDVQRTVEARNALAGVLAAVGA